MLDKHKQAATDSVTSERPKLSGFNRERVELDLNAFKPPSDIGQQDLF